MSCSFWLILGLFSQFLFFTRFLVQWITSERKKKSIIPLSFWYLSIFGSVGLLIYSVYKKDLVFIIGQSLGVLVYARNIILLKKENSKSHINNGR